MALRFFQELPKLFLADADGAATQAKAVVRELPLRTKSVNHSLEEWVRGDVHTYSDLLKGFRGTWPLKVQSSIAPKAIAI